MTTLSSYLEERGWILRSGGADGADSDFEKGVKNPKNKEIYLPWKGFNNSDSELYLGNVGHEDEAEEVAKRIHFNYAKLSQGAKKLHTRNGFQILGKDFNTPSKLVIAWTKNGEEVGGTRTALVLAKEHKIKIHNLYHNQLCYKWMDNIGLKNLYYSGMIESLNENEVFVFGSNLQGFHGAGSAGFASFNKPGNVWREEEYDKKPNGWKGKWNVKGIGEGFQEGTIGKSYALPTVIKAGHKRSLTLEQISENITRLYNFALDNPQWWFILAYKNDGKNLNGYTFEEFSPLFYNPPKNIVFHEDFRINRETD
jgi:hypothetical protein